jgi:hypothetical protein
MAYSDHQAAKIQQPTITGAIHDFDTQIERIAKYNDQLSNLNDRVNGPRPREIEKNREPIDTPSQSLINAINVRRSRLVEALDEMDVLLKRLEGSI